MIRAGSLLVLTTAWTAVSTSCFPINIDRTDQLAGLAPETELAVSLIKPTRSSTVAEGSLISVEWTAINKTGADGVVSVSVRKRDDREETIIAGGIRMASTSTHDSLDWNTEGFRSGRYAVILRLQAGDKTEEEVSTISITINTRPTLVFTEPTADATLENDADTSDEDVPEINIRWSASDADGDGKLVLELDPDLDHENDNSVTLVESDLPSEDALDSFTFIGNDSAGARVSAGQYFIVARLTDDANAESFVVGSGRITVLERPEASENGIDEPNEDTAFLSTTTPTIDVIYTLAGTGDVLIDLKIDTDDVHTDGNELTILGQLFQDRNTTRQTFIWNGNDSSGVPVPDGLYRIFMVVSTGSGTPSTVDASGLVFRRSVENKPLIGITSPTTDQTLRGGAFLTIQWRDDDPSATGKVFLFIDDDPNPEEAVETGAPEREILANRQASPDGVQDSFALQIPNDLAPGTYHIFAYIDRDGARPFEHSDRAAGRIIIRDPNN